MPERFVQDSIRAGEAIAPPSSLLGEVLPPRFEAVADAAFAGEIGVRSTALISRMLTQAGHLGRCVNCGAPASWSEIHHVQHRQHGGPTDANNGVLLCSSCHHILHSGIIQVRMIDGVPHLKTRYDDTWKRAGINRAHDTRRRQRGLSSVPAKDGPARASGAPPSQPIGPRPRWS